MWEERKKSRLNCFGLEREEKRECNSYSIVGYQTRVLMLSELADLPGIAPMQRRASAACAVGRKLTPELDFVEDGYRLEMEVEDLA